MARGGRPTLYLERYEVEVYRLALLGLDDREIASVFGVSVATLNNWKRQHPEFLESMKRGKAIADSKVAASLFMRAVGYEHEDVDIRVIGRRIVTTKVKKRYPPETLAAIFWLKNRQSGKWFDRTAQNVVPPVDPQATARALRKALKAIEEMEGLSGDDVRKAIAAMRDAEGGAVERALDAVDEDTSGARDSDDVPPAAAPRKRGKWKT